MVSLVTGTSVSESTTISVNMAAYNFGVVVSQYGMVGVVCYEPRHALCVTPRPDRGSPDR